MYEEGEGRVDDDGDGSDDDNEDYGSDHVDTLGNDKWNNDNDKWNNFLIREAINKKKSRFYGHFPYPP